MPNENLQRYSRHVYFNQEDEAYVALCTEFPHLSAFGDTPAEALQELDAALEAAVEIHEEEGWPIPQPEAPPQPEGMPSGRFVIRLPKTLHAQLVQQAKRDGVSLNQLATSYLSAGLGAARHEMPTSLLQTEESAWVSSRSASDGRKVHDALPQALVSHRGDSEHDLERDFTMPTIASDGTGEQTLAFGAR